MRLSRLRWIKPCHTNPGSFRDGLAGGRHGYRSGNTSNACFKAVSLLFILPGKDLINRYDIYSGAAFTAGDLGGIPEV